MNKTLGILLSGFVAGVATGGFAIYFKTHPIKETAIIPFSCFDFAMVISLIVFLSMGLLRLVSNDHNVSIGHGFWVLLMNALIGDAISTYSFGEISRAIDGYFYLIFGLLGYFIGVLVFSKKTKEKEQSN